MSRQSRSAFTLLEICVAMGLFSLLMAAVLECMGTVHSYVNRASMQSDLVLESRRLVEEIVNDLGASAWYIPNVADGGPQLVPADEMGDPLKDRSIRYYPYIQVQSPGGLGSQFPLHARAANEVVDPALVAAGLPAVHKPASQEIIFIKVRTGPAAPTPRELVPDTIDFNTLPTKIAVYSAKRKSDDLATLRGPLPDGLPKIESLTLELDPSQVITDMPLKWESVSDAIPPTPNILIREYTYVVVPDASSGKSRLERRYRNGCGTSPEPLVLDRVLSDNVDRLVVDTYRTDATLNISQIRFTLYLSHELEDQPGNYVTQRIEVTTALRSLANGLGSATLATRVGSAGGFKVPSP